MYEPCTGQAILAAPALIYSAHWVLVVWIIAAHFHLCSVLGTLSRYTIGEVWAVRQPMRVCCGSRWGRYVLFINILDSLTAPCWVYNKAMYTVYGRCGQYGWPVHGSYTVGAWFIRNRCKLKISWPPHHWSCSVPGPFDSNNRPEPVHRPVTPDQAYGKSGPCRPLVCTASDHASMPNETH